MPDINSKQLPPVPEISDEERERALAFLMKPNENLDNDTTLALRFLTREVIKLWYEVTYLREQMPSRKTYRFDI